jgi:GAF domain-containing protein
MSLPETFPPPFSGHPTSQRPPSVSHEMITSLADHQHQVTGRYLTRPSSRSGNVFDRLTRLAADLLDASAAFLTAIYQNRNFLIGSHGPDDPIHAARMLPLVCNIRQEIVSSKRPVIVTDASNATRRSDPPTLGIGSYTGLALVTGSGRTIGALFALDGVIRDWTGDQLAALANVASIAGEEMQTAWPALAYPE